MATDTREKILETARVLFNEHGLSQVGIRDIARATKISPGNLSYHFATKDALVAAVVMQLHQVNTETIFAKLPETFSLETLYRAAIGAMRLMLRYRFVLLSYVDAVRASDELQRLQGTLRAKQIQRSRMMCELLVKNGYVTRAVLNAPYLEEQSSMISSGWLNAAKFHPELHDDEAAILHYAKVGCALLAPFCTPKGKRQMRRILAGELDANGSGPAR